MIGSEVTFAVRPPRKCQFGSSEMDDEPQEGSKKISQVMFEPPECFCCIRSKLWNDGCYSFSIHRNIQFRDEQSTNMILDSTVAILDNTDPAALL